MTNPLITRFLSIINKKYEQVQIRHTTHVSSFFKFIYTFNHENEELIKFITTQPLVLTMQYENKYIFDFFYDITLHCMHIDKYYNYWLKILLKAIDLMIKYADDTELSSLQMNPKYIQQLQSSNMSHVDLFCHLIDNNFESVDKKNLIYSAIVRDEVSKLRCLYYNQNYNELFTALECPVLFDLAIGYGRYNVLDWLIQHIDVGDFGKVYDLCNFEMHDIFMYNSTINRPNNYSVIIRHSKQDYIKCFELLNEYIEINTSKKTLTNWINRHDSIKYKWDICSSQIFDIIKFIKDTQSVTIPLYIDYGRFNKYVHGYKMSSRKYIITRLIDLEQEIMLLRNSYIS